MNCDDAMSGSTIKRDETETAVDAVRALLKAGCVARAEIECDRILDQHPDHLEALRFKGICCLERGDKQRSLETFKDLLLRSPDNAEIYTNIGSVHHALKDYEQAVTAYEKALSLAPDLSVAANNLGNTYQALGRDRDAIRLYRRALSYNPGLAQIHNNLGSALNNVGDTNAALKSFNKALELTPAYADAWNNLGACLARLGLIESAVAAYDKALDLNSRFPGALNNKGNLLLAARQAAPALRCYENAVALDPELTEAWNGLGNAQRLGGRLSDAVESYRSAIALKEDYAQAWNNLGLTLADQGLLDDAIDAFRAALQIKPGYFQCHSNLLLFLNYQPALDEQDLAAEHLNWARSHQKKAATERRAKSSSKSRLRIGYVSADFVRHPVSYFILPLLEHHDRRKFRVYCYSNSVAEDDVTEQLKTHCEHWRSISHVRDGAAAQLVRDDEIDVLFDLSGHTSGHRLQLFSLGPAPVQISWLGYPHTTGLDCMDYVLSDKVNLPDRLQVHYSERIATLDCRCCYQAPAYAPDIGAPPVLRNGKITFGSFSNPVKINAALVSLWSRILLSVRGSTLVLSWKSLSDPSIANRLIDMFHSNGVDASSIELRGGVIKHEQVLADYNDIDIALDTYPFSGGLTSCEALWMGVPVITLAGVRPASRQTAGFLSTLDLHELIASSTDAFVENGIRLAGDQQKLATIRRSLRERMTGSALCNGELFTGHFEQTLLRIARSHQLA
ncbi:MAG: tetratricopeptide repeat protein [Gammaproteobacteria bacterium]